MPQPEFAWDPGLRRYRDARGRLVSRAAVRAALDAAIDRAALDMRSASLALQRGSIEVGDWQLRMEAGLKAIHVASGAAAAGGWAQADAATWSAVAVRLKAQYQFLRSFAVQLRNGLPLDGRFLARAQSYAISGTGTYEAILRRADLAAGYDLERRVLRPGPRGESCPECVAYAARGWQPSGVLPDIGVASSCGPRCRCRFERRRGSVSATRQAIPGVSVTSFAGPEVDFDVPGTVAGPEFVLDDDPPARPEGWWSRLVAFATKGKLKRSAHAGLNAGCGTGAGGFKKGNTCGRRAGAHGTGKGGTQKHRKALAAKIRALRGQAKAPEQKKALVDAIRVLKAHERGDASASAQAAKIRRAIHEGKVPKAVAAPKPTPTPKQPTAREQIKAAVAAKRAGRGLTPGQRKIAADLARKVRSRRAEAGAGAAREAAERASTKTFGGPIDPDRPIADRLKTYSAGAGEAKRQAVLAATEPHVARKAAIQKELDDLAGVRNIVAYQSEFDSAKRKAEFYSGGKFKRDAEAKLAELGPKLEAAKAHRTALRAEKVALDAKIREAAAEALEVDDPVTITWKHGDIPHGWNGPLTPLEAGGRARADEAAAFVSKITRKGDGARGAFHEHLADLPIGQRDGQRPYSMDAGKNSHIGIDPNETTATIVHEIGHQVEARLDIGPVRALQRVNSFLKDRVGPEAPVSLKDRFGGYRADELGRKDKFDEAFSEREAYYVGKDYGGHLTEVISMGIEKLHNDPVGFARKDPEYFDFLTGVLGGELR